MFSISYETLTLKTANHLYVSIKSKKQTKIKIKKRVNRIFLGKSYSAISAGNTISSLYLIWFIDKTEFKCVCETNKHILGLNVTVESLDIKLFQFL